MIEPVLERECIILDTENINLKNALIHLEKLNEKKSRINICEANPTTVLYLCAFVFETRKACILVMQTGCRVQNIICDLINLNW